VANGGHTVICGLERISLRVARALIQLGEQVTIVAESPEPALLREARRVGARVIDGATADVARLHNIDLESARCIVLTEDDDLRNVQAALATRELNPGIRVVLRMFNADLADRATRLLVNSKVVSISTVAAPYFAAEALGMDATPTRLVWGRHVVVDPMDGGDDPEPEPRGSGLGGAAARLRARLRGRQARRATAVELGEGEFLHPVEPPAPSRRWQSPRQLRLQRALLSLLDPRLAVLATGLTLLVGVSVAIFHAQAGLYRGAGQPTLESWIDGLVFTATTAYGNTDLSAAAGWVKVYAVGFMFAAALGLALTFGLVADVIVSEQIVAALSVPRRMRNHVVVLGLGNTGYRTVLHLLEAGVEVAAAESRAGGRFVAIARRRGVPVLIAEAHFADSLRALSVDHARAVVVTTNDDLANLEAALAARELNPGARVVTRLFDPELAKRAQEQLHLTACQSSSALATPAFTAAALGDGVLSTIERGGMLWLLAEVHVPTGSAVDGEEVEELESSGDLRVLAVRSGGRVWWRPFCPARVEAGSDVLVASSRDAWEALLSRVAAVGMEAPPEAEAGTKAEPFPV
jgi:Trk K+ transport system NAD-binding subunit